MWPSNPKVRIFLSAQPQLALKKGTRHFPERTFFGKNRIRLPIKLRIFERILKSCCVYSLISHNAFMQKLTEKEIFGVRKKILEARVLEKLNAETELILLGGGNTKITPAENRCARAVEAPSSHISEGTMLRSNRLMKN